MSMVLQKVLRVSVVILLLGVASSAMAGAAATESLSLCGQCLNPSVSSKSGIGTANAVVEAKITRQDAVNWCSGWHPEDGNCVTGQMASDEAKKTYRATANCVGGKITAIDGKSYSLYGARPSGVGKGRARFRDAAGATVGQDEGSGGLAIAQQWEILCPASAKAASPPPTAATHLTTAATATPVGAQFTAGEAVEAKYMGQWLPGKVRRVIQSTGSKELTYDVLLDNGQSGMLPASWVRKVK
jgi:hypothetical protein